MYTLCIREKKTKQNKTKQNLHKNVFTFLHTREETFYFSGTRLDNKCNYIGNNSSYIGFFYIKITI